MGDPFYATALYNFEVTQEGDLPFNEGDVIYVTGEGDDGWWLGELNGQSGYFPVNYVQVNEDGGEFVDDDWGGPSDGRVESFMDSPAIDTNYDAMYTDDAVGQYVSAPPQEQVVVLPGTAYQPKDEYFHITISEPEKKKKFAGMKKFVAYLVTSENGQGWAVLRRYKHFTWLRERLLDRFPLIPIPQLPDKQVSGRFEEDFIESRRKGLQEFLNLIARHPVLRSSTVFVHFLSVDDEKDNKSWKDGKRQAEKNEYNGKNFYSSIVHESPIEPVAYQSIDAFVKMIQVQDKYQKDLSDSVAGLQARRADMSKAVDALGARFCELGGEKEGGMCWHDSCSLCEGVGAAFLAVGGAAKKLAEGEAAQAQEEVRLSDLSTLYRSYHKDFQNQVKIEKGARSTYHSADAKFKKKAGGVTPAESAKLLGLQQRSDLVAAATQAEMEHFHQMRAVDYKRALRDYVQKQVEYHRQVAETWSVTLAAIEAVDADADAFQY